MLEAKNASNAELIRFLDEDDKAAPATPKKDAAPAVDAPKADKTDKPAPAAPKKEEDQ
jgi:hypothetical protein